MATQDTCCTIVPYFTIHDGTLKAVKALCEKFVEKPARNPSASITVSVLPGTKPIPAKGIRMPRGCWPIWILCGPKLKRQPRSNRTVRGESPRRGGGPPLSVGSVGRAERLLPALQARGPSPRTKGSGEL